jgi:hypothetical protein
MVVDGFSSGAEEVVCSSCASTNVMKLEAAMPITDVINFI